MFVLSQLSLFRMGTRRFVDLHLNVLVVVIDVHTILYRMHIYDNDQHIQMLIYKPSPHTKQTYL